MILPTLRWLVGAAQAVGEGAGALWRLVRSARRGALPDQTDPIPLTEKDVEHIQGQIRQATEQRLEMRPPPKSTRYD